jgi:hypothetical protein
LDFGISLSAFDEMESKIYGASTSQTLTVEGDIVPVIAGGKAVSVNVKVEGNKEIASIFLQPESRPIILFTVRNVMLQNRPMITQTKILRPRVVNSGEISSLGEGIKTFLSEPDAYENSSFLMGLYAGKNMITGTPT